MTGSRTIIKITGNMPSANGTTILTGNSFAFFSASNILLERMSSLNSLSVVATSPPSSTECRNTATKDAASSNPSRSANAPKASTELLPARISAPINSMLWPSARLRLLSRSRILSNDASTVRPAVTQTVNRSKKIRKIQPVLGELRRLTAGQIGVRPKDPDPDGGRRGQHELQS